jgi:hypothetical protein
MFILKWQFPKQNMLMRRVALFDFYEISVMSPLIEHSSILSCIFIQFVVIQHVMEPLENFSEHWRG